MYSILLLTLPFCYTRLSYYLGTASPNDILMGGLGVGYTEPMIYLGAYPDRYEVLWEDYARFTDRAIGWIDSSLLWLIDGQRQEADRYACGSSGRLKGIFIGYGGAPDITEARLTHNRVVLNWGLEMSMLQEVQAMLGPDYVCVRPDVLVELRREAEVKAGRD